MILERLDQAISSTDLQRRGKELLDRLTSGEQDKYIVLRDNKPAVAMLSIQNYEDMLHELDRLRAKHK